MFNPRRRNIRALVSAIETLESRRLLSASGTKGAAALGITQSTFYRINDVSAFEGDSGNTDFTFTVSRNGNTDVGGAVQVDTFEQVDSTPGVDYQEIRGLLVGFAPGDVSKAVTLHVFGDTDIEADEHVSVQIGFPVLSGQTDQFIGDAEGIATIVNDDFKTSFRIEDNSKVEGNSGNSNLAFTVRRNGDTTGTDVVSYSSANNTADNSDFQAVASSLTFAPGETVKTINVPIIGDTIVEPNEEFTVTLSSPGPGRIGIGTIVNDDVAPATAKLAINDVSKIEGDSGTSTLTFNVTRTGSTIGKSTVKFATANGSASSTSDYTSQSGTLTFNAGEVTKTLTITIKGDKTVEDFETFKVNLGGAAGATIADNSGTGTIQNDDTSIAIADVKKAEGNSGQSFALATVTLAKKSAKPVTVKYKAADGTAKAGSDYLAASGTIIFAAGETSKQIKITILGDTKKESDESFFINLASAVNAAIADAQAKVTIGNDD